MHKVHFYAKISGHDLAHPTNRVAVHSITEKKIENTSTVLFLVNMKLRNLLESSILCLNVWEPRKHKTITCLPMHDDQQRIVSWVYNSDEFSEFEHSEVLHTSKFISESDSVKTCMFPALCMELCTQTSHFHCKQYPAGRHACIYNSMQRAIAYV
jgi:hypothetical protein